MRKLLAALGVATYLVLATFTGAGIADNTKNPGHGNSASAPGQLKKDSAPATEPAAPSQPAVTQSATPAQTEAPAQPAAVAQPEHGNSASAPGQAKKDSTTASEEETQSSAPASKPAKADKGAKKQRSKSGSSSGNSGSGTTQSSGSSDQGSSESSSKDGGKGSNEGSGKSKGSDNGKGSDRGKSSEAHAKVTICHATGSATNPYVEITISGNAAAAHRRHQGGEDIVPTAAGGCPKGSKGGKGGKGHKKVTICHATGSATNPYVEITISENAVKAHQRHQGGQDIIPAPTGGCPKGTKGGGGGGSSTSGGKDGTTIGAVPVEKQPKTVNKKGKIKVKGARASKHAQGGGRIGGAIAGAGSTLGATATSGELPFTGFPLWLAFLAAIAFAGAGFGLRRQARNS